MVMIIYNDNNDRKYNGNHNDNGSDNESHESMIPTVIS